MSKILKNTTGSSIPITDTGVSIAASPGQYTIPPQDYLLWAASADVVTHIGTGDIVVNDGVTDLSVARGSDFIKHPDTAFNIRFLSEPERSNDLVKKNVQEAMEELQGISNPLRVPISLVYNGTLSNGDFIGYSNLIPGDLTPIIVPISGDFVEFTWSNKNATADFALEFRKNTTGGAAFFTWSVDNTLSAAVLLPTPQTFSLGDAIYVKYIDEGTNGQDAAVVLLFKS